MTAYREDENGNIVEYTIEEENQFAIDKLDNNRKEKIKQIKEEGLNRIKGSVPEISSFELVDFMVMLWPMLNTTSPPSSIASARDIYLYAKTKIAQAQTANQAQLDAYDPSTDNGWPT